MSLNESEVRNIRQRWENRQVGEKSTLYPGDSTKDVGRLLEAIEILRGEILERERFAATEEGGVLMRDLYSRFEELFGQIPMSPTLVNEERNGG